MLEVLTPISESLAMPIQTLALGLDFSIWQLLIILCIALLLFGGRLPEVMRNMGRGVTEFKKGLRSIEEETNPNAPPSGQGYQPQPYQQQLPPGQVQGQVQGPSQGQPVYRAPVPQGAPMDQQGVPGGYAPQQQYPGGPQAAPYPPQGYPAQPGYQQPPQSGYQPYPPQR